MTSFEAIFLKYTQIFVEIVAMVAEAAFSICLIKAKKLYWQKTQKKENNVSPEICSVEYS